jgi:phosphate butyryltransferase
VENQKRFLEAVAEIGKANVSLAAYERQLHSASEGWLGEIKSMLDADVDHAALSQTRIDLASMIESMASYTGRRLSNQTFGRALSLLVQLDRQIDDGPTIMRRLLTRSIADKAERDKKRMLIINPGTPSTRIAYFEGLSRVHNGEAYIQPDDDDTVDTRLAAIRKWLDERKIDMQSIDGIACRGGFPSPIPTGIYRVVPEMIHDLESPEFDHASNMGVFIGQRLAELTNRPGNVMLITRDTAGSDEVELVERMTGYVKIRRDGVGCHYLNHRAVWNALSSSLGRKMCDVDMVSAHLGGGISIALHRNGHVTSVMDALSDMPSANRSGMLNLARLIPAIMNNEMPLKELQRAMTTQGGLLSLTGTNNMTTLINFMRHSATPQQSRKIELVLDFFARRIASSMMHLLGDGRPVQLMAITGGLANVEELVTRITQNLNDLYPVAVLPGTLENESLVSGLLTGFYEPEQLRDYVVERENHRKLRSEEDRLMETSIFERKVLFKKQGAPITTLDEIIDAAWYTVEQNKAPTIAIVGAANEEAILAAKRANAEGQYRLAKFLLCGDFDKINKIAYDFDLVIDNDNYTVIDTEDPVSEALKAIEDGRAHIMMKGNIHTEDILRGTFRYLKANNKIDKGQVMSHVAVMDIPNRNKLLFFSDGAVNTYPDKDKRVSILENTLIVAHNLNITIPKVAVISAIENVNKSVESSIEAEYIAQHFANRDDCIVEGPLSFDVAMDQKIAEEKHYPGKVRGSADVLILPDIDAGNVLWKTLTTQSGASVAGVIMCGSMPLVLTSRGDSARSKLASLSLAVKLYFDLNKQI